MAGGERLGVDPVISGPVHQFVLGQIPIQKRRAARVERLEDDVRVLALVEFDHDYPQARGDGAFERGNAMSDVIGLFPSSQPRTWSWKY